MHAILRERLKWSLLLRVVVVTLMLGAAATLQAGVSEPAVPRPLTALYVLIGLTYALTVAYAILLRRHGQRLPLFAYLQVVHDLIFATITVALTGSLESPFVVLYTLGIVNASLLLYRRGTILAVSLAVMALAALAHVPDRWLSGRGDEPLGWLVTPGQAADLTFVLSLAGFVAIGALASYLADQLRR
ncbi:MAG: PAS domain-containing sensor histidine kinase, partial [Candidatus Rokuibacteriota bacterium]